MSDKQIVFMFCGFIILLSVLLIISLYIYQNKEDKKAEKVKQKYIKQILEINQDYFSKYQTEDIEIEPDVLNLDAEMRPVKQYKDSSTGKMYKIPQRCYVFAFLLRLKSSFINTGTYYEDKKDKEYLYDDKGNLVEYVTYIDPKTFKVIGSKL